ncbi:PREDICTED: histone-lysine N-methyltransferase setd3 [Nicrophorus vespilloides]|uniref:protein-histidine N-methyltransferase n=1 Tax=Nicrophorus vespilloides TaxID=110193 RepID=A0ABM1N6E5_NICVS|nr:PREDICTED: histone-lysine N-methyltransferase setd3 [Nicrophorus vespilloides]
MGRKSQSKHNKPRPNLNNKQQKLSELVDQLLRVTVKTPHANVTKELEAHKEIFALTEKINELEANEICTNRTDGAALEAFKVWLKDNGAKFDGTSIAHFEGYDLGLKTEVDIVEGSLIIAIPRKIMLTLDSAMHTTLAPLLEKDAILKNMPNVVLAMFLLVEKFKEDSFWKPYIDVLPNNYSTVLYYDYLELEELIGSPNLKLALKQIKSICRQYAYFYKLIHTSEESVCLGLRGKFSFKQYCWAVSTVMTRQNTIPSEDKAEMTSALIPLWDFCNHTNGNISTDYNPMEDRSECLAVRDFKKGEQLFIFYGARTNSDLFIHNGFVYEENEHDGFALSLGISQSDPLREKRAILLEKLLINPNSTFYLNNGQQPIIGELLAFLRVFNMNEDQLQHWIESDKCADLQCLDCALDTVLEKKTWSFLQIRIKLLLAAYKTTLEDDEKRLAANILKPNRKLAIRMRVTEKKILKTVLDYVEQCIKQ